MARKLSQKITVQDGDQVDVIGVFGRPARIKAFFVDTAGDDVTLALNHLTRSIKPNVFSADQQVLRWRDAGAANVVDLYLSGVGEDSTPDGLFVDSFEVTDLTLSSGSELELYLY